ncbi:MAG: hypothetical protein NZ518_00330, partial [Dehalococcoidia bacterium]|nr:hypothetical protein [Dehalococcoidia bacterium]
MQPPAIRRHALETFAPFSRLLAAAFVDEEPRVAARYSPEAYAAWATTAIRVATASFRSWEAALEFVRASGPMAATLSEPDFMAWAEAGDRLAAKSAIVAAAYFAVSPTIAILLAPNQLPTWAELGERLHGESWKAISLAVRYFEQSPQLLRDLSLEDLTTFIGFVAALAVRSYEAATEALEHGRAMLLTLAPGDRQQALRMAERVAATSWRTAQTLFRETPPAVRDLDPATRRAVLALAERLAERHPDETPSFLKECVAALAKAPAAKRHEYVTLAAPLATRSWRAVAAFIASAPQVEERAGAAGLATWRTVGQDILDDNPDAGVAFFQLQSSRARQEVEALSPGVALSAVADILRMYGAALTGRDIRIASTAELTARAVGWTQVERPATDGVAVHVPPYLDRYGDKDANFAAYKVLVTHQTSHLEFGTFAFQFDRPAAVHTVNERDALPFDPTMGHFEQFFDSFAERKLAKDLFTVVEDFRIDHRIRHEYPGIRRALETVQAHALASRPRRALPMQELLVEYLIRLSLAFEEQRQRPAMAPLAAFLAPLANPAATVEDS